MSENSENVAKSDDELFQEAFDAEYLGATKEPDTSDTNAPVEVADTDVTTPDENAATTGDIATPEIDYATRLNEALANIDKLKKSLDTTNGTYGQRIAQMNTVISELSRRLEQQQSASKVLVPKLNLAKLKEAQYDELADILQSAFDESFREFNELPSQKPFDPEPYVQQIDARIKEVDDRITRREQEMELKLLKREHPDYAEVAGYRTNDVGMVIWNNFAFGNWVVQNLPSEDQQQLVQSNDAGFLSDVITRYKKSVEDAHKQAPNVSEVNVNIESAIAKNAIRPKSGGKPAVGKTKTDDELFQEAYEREIRSY